MKRRIITLLVVLGLVIQLSACGSVLDEEAADAATVETESNTTDKDNTESGENPEDEGGASDQSDAEQDAEEAVDADMDYLAVYKPALEKAREHLLEYEEEGFTTSSVGYLLYDIDKDGYKEFVVDFFWDWDAGHHAWCFTIRDGECVQLQMDQRMDGTEYVYDVLGGLKFDYGYKDGALEVNTWTDMDSDGNYLDTEKYSVYETKIEGDKIVGEMLDEGDLTVGELDFDIRTMTNGLDVDAIEDIPDSAWYSLSTDDGLVHPIWEDTASDENTEDYWIYSDPDASGVNSLVYQNGQFTVKGSWHRAADRDEAWNGSEVQIDETFKRGKKLLYGAWDEELVHLDFDEFFRDEDRNILADYSVYLHIQNGEIVEIIQSS